MKPKVFTRKLFRKIGNEISQRQRTEKILRSHCISSLFTSETLCRKCRTQTNPIHCLLYELNSSSFQICLDSVMEHFDLSLTTISFLHFALDGCTQIIILFSSSSLMLMKTDGFFFLLCFVLFSETEKRTRGYRTCPFNVSQERCSVVRHSCSSQSPRNHVTSATMSFFELQGRNVALAGNNRRRF